MRDVVVAVVTLAVLLAVPFFVESPGFFDFAIRVASTALFATSLNLLVGGTGMVSFGHGLFYGFGAYCFALTMQRTEIALPIAAAGTLIAAAVIALVVGAICIRLRQIYFRIRDAGDADAGLQHRHCVVRPDRWRPGIAGRHSRGARRMGFNLSQHVNLYGASVVVAVIGLLLMRQVMRSPFGASLRMIRDNESRAAFLGIGVVRAKLTVFVIAGVFAALGGILGSLFVSGAYPEQANWTISGEAIFAVMLGGIGSFLGPLVGTVILLALNDVVGRFTEYHGLVLGGVILIVVLGFRRGVLDVIRSWRFA